MSSRLHTTHEGLSPLERIRFDDFDACAAALSSWEIEAIQLDRGGFAAELAQAQTPTAVVSEIYFGRALHQRGEPPKGMRTLGVAANPAQRIFFRSHWTHSNQLMFFPSGSEMDSVSLPGFHVFSVSFPEDRLSDVSQALGGSDFEGLLAGREIVDCSPERMQLVRLAAREFVEAENRCESASRPELERLDRGAELLQKIVEILTLEADLRPPEPSLARELAIRRCLDLLETVGRERLSVADLCRAAGVSRRTLEYAFQERFELSPNAYLLARRLSGVRAELNQHQDDASVTRIAARWGFDHLSRFAAFYRRQFGELPSETIRASKSSA